MELNSRQLLKSLWIMLFSILCSYFFIVNQVNAATNPKPLRIAVAANFAPILEKLLTEFSKKNNIPVQVISGASGSLFLQIMHGAPFDVFLSADTERPSKLEAHQLIVNHSRRTYAIGELALWSSKRIFTLDDLALISPEQRLAIANPDTAPYGKAAKETLLSISLWQGFKQRLVTGINVNQTFQQVRSQSVELGFVANSQLILNNLKGTVIPSEYHKEIKQQVVILKSSQQKENAVVFSRFLLSKASQDTIKQYGYTSEINSQKSHYEP